MNNMRRGIKHKIKIEKIENKNARTVAFTKRRNGLNNKLSELSRQNPGTQFAFLAEPVSSNSHASFYSFGHSSVDHVVSAFLSGQTPLPVNQENNSGFLEFWWEDERFDTSEDVDELNQAIDAVSTMLNNVRLRLNDVVNSKQNDTRFVIHHPDLEELLQDFSEETNQVPLLEGGETSGAAASSLLMDQKNDLQVDDYLTDFNYDLY